MELCSVTALAKDVGRGVVESAFLMVIEPANSVATKEVDTDVVGTNGENGSVANEDNRSPIWTTTGLDPTFQQIVIELTTNFR